MIFKIAWRNIWRNKRRTLITAASIFFAVVFCVSGDSYERGVYDNMINSAIHFYFGYAQVHQKGYWDDRSINNSFALTDSLEQQINSQPEVKHIVPRLESFALVSFGKATKSALVVGTLPDKEAALTNLPQKIAKGEYITAKDKSILVAEGLAEKLDMTVGDTLVLLSQGYRGVNAANMYPIKGIVHFGSPDLNRQMIYMPLALAQDFYGAYGQVTTAVLNFDNKYDFERAMPQLYSKIDTAEAYELLGWEQLMPELVEMRNLDTAGNYIIQFILYLIVSFGIFGTLLMMTKERMFEFGVLVAIGMGRAKLAMVTWLEVVFIGILGAGLGLLFSYGLMYYLYVNPIVVTGDMAATYEQYGIEPTLLPSLELFVFFKQFLVVVIITTLLAIYPGWKIWQMNAVEAMRD